MAYHYSAYRPLTPITPIHTPHTSSGSVRVRTPGQLSLHEYRKQQATPSPPAVSGQKTVKRKDGIQFLNRKGNRPTAARPSAVRLSSPSPPDSPVEAMPARSASPPIRNTLFPEFIHLVSSSPPTAPSTTTELAEGFQPMLHASPPVQRRASAGEGEGNARRHDPNERVHQLQFQSLGGNFKPIKRLPHPPAPDWRHPTPPPIRLSSSSNSLPPSSEGLASSSTLSLSKFDFPNPPPLALSVPTSAIEPHPVSLATAPSTPTVLHYRGAAFDLINPHDSLRLSRIQTPPERDYNQSDFTAVPSLQDLIAEQMAQSDRGTAPPRALFDNFNTAFASITKSSSGLKANANASASTDTLLPATTTLMPTAPPQHDVHDYPPSGEPSRAHPPGKDNTPTQESPLRRIARRLPNLRNFKRKDTVVDETQAMSQVAAEPPRIGPQAFECNIQPTVPDRWWEELPKLGLAMLEDGQDGPPKDTLSRRTSNSSNTAFEPSHGLGSDSYYADSTTGSYRPPSTVIGHRQTIAFGHKTGLLDYTDETADPSSHPYEFSEPSHNDPPTSHSQHVRNVASNPPTDTLLSGTIRGGQRDGETPTPEGDQWQQSLLAEGTMVGMSARGHEDEKRREEYASGLGQFDFGLDWNSPLREAGFAAAPGWSSPESIPVPLTIAPGPPPTTPLPPAPYSGFVETPYTQNFGTRCQSDVDSSCVSYGDTRNLLNPEGGDHLSASSLDTMRGVTERNAEDMTTQATAQSELPFNVEIADASTHDAYDLEPVREEPFPSESSMPEIGRALTTVSADQQNEISDVAELSTDICPDGAYVDDRSLRVAPLNVTPKDNHDATVSTFDQPHRDADDQDEWETVIDDSRQNLTDVSSDNNLSRFPRNVRDFSAAVHPAHSTFNVSRYRLRSPAGSGEPFMVPEYQYGPSSAFTFRNALTPPVAAAVVPGSSSSSPSQRPKAQRMARQIDALHHAANTDSPYVDPKLLSPDPNDDIVYEGRPLFLSQPAPPHGNSFAKFTELGPNANLTGSFLGTGMREAGSSLADSSSPAHPNSSPRAQYKPSPLAQVVVGREEPSTPTDAMSFAPQSEYNVQSQEMQTPDSRHTTALKHKPRCLPIAPPQAHTRTPRSRDEHFGLQRASRSGNMPRSAVTNPPQRAISGVVRSPPPSYAQLHVGSPNSTPYNPFRKPPVPAIPHHDEDLIELDSLPSRSSLSRPFRLASRANNTLSRDTLRTQSTGYSMLVPSRYESSAHSITPLRANRARSHTSGIGHHRRQFSGSGLAQLRLSHSEVVLRRHKQAMEEFSERIRKKEEFWSDFILWALCWTAAVPLCVWGTDKLDPLMVWLTGVNGATFTEQSKRKSLIVGVFFGILYCTAVAVLIPLGVTGVVKWT